MEKIFQSAWLPITPRGVAAFAQAKVGRLWLVQFIVALIVAVFTGWFVNAAWFSVVRDAIQQFPAAGEIRFQHLHWPDESPRLLAEGHFLAFSVDEKHSGTIRSPAHIQVEFGNDSVAAYSLFGYAQEFYPQGWLPFNRTRLEPWWDAWRPMLLAGIIGTMLVGLLVNWTVLATIYFLLVWLVGFFTNRHLNFAASWKLAGAALMPGALFFTAAIFFYALGLLDLVQLSAAFAMHFIIGWIYLFIAPMFLPKDSSVAIKKNPFTSQNKS